MDIVQSLVLICIIQLFGFFLAFTLRTDKFTDLFYGLTFAFLAIYALAQNPSLASLVLALMISLWAFRLSGYLFIRIRKIERDKRFDRIRGDFLKFFGFWCLQAAAIFIISLPIVFFTGEDLTAFSLLGIAVWLCGFVIETVADYQKYSFMQKSKGFIRTGLWKYSRHPNYLGEILVWVGVYLYTFPGLSGLQHIAIASPLFITFLLVFVSGIPILERNADRKFGKSREYQEYKTKTGVLLPKLGR
jgi:steroid 5-alpha reductase family enzyme